MIFYSENNNSIKIQIPWILVIYILLRNRILSYEVDQTCFWSFHDEEVKVHLTREKRHANDARDLSEKSKIEFIDRYLELSGNLTDEQRKRITEIADKCPVHKTLTNGLQVNTTLKD